MEARTQFPPQPRSAGEARHWVRDHLTEMGRADLVDSAEAGVSELVTNCILHAQTSIGLQMTGYNSRVIIEVYDAAPMVHQPAGDPAVPDTADSTIGRGLRIVRAHAQEWGVSTSAQGKAIWFQPTPSSEAVDDAGSAGPGGGSTETAGTAPEAADEHSRREPHPVLHLDATLDALAEAFPEPEGSADERDDASADGPGGDERAVVRLLGVPPWVVQHYRKRWLELIREMQLVALAEPSAQQAMAQRFCRATQVVEPELYLVEGVGGRSFAVSDGGEAVDMVFDVRPSMRPALVRVRDMAREMEKKWAGIQLLYLHPGAQAVQLREWWLAEFIGQIDGAEPTSWPGEMDVRDEAMASVSDA
jgi:anti-sigma regulatory factor (Ser/Thr protein kinase)